MKDKKNFIIVLLCFVLLTIYYFQYSVSITWDSAHYLGYVRILERMVPFSNWDVVRGPVFPFIIYFSNFLFSKSSQGLIMCTYFYYLIMIIFSYKLIDYFLEKIKIKGKVKKIIQFILMMILIFNPVVYGYYHCLLTEFVAITLSVISCYFAVTWLDTDFDKNKKQYLVLNILFVLLTIFSWFLKQPYVSCGFFALVVAYILSLFQLKNKKEFIVRSLTLVSCILFLLVGIKGWNLILNSYGNDTNTTRNPSNALGVQLINAVDYLEVIDLDKNGDLTFIDSLKLTKKEKKELNKLIKNEQNFILINKYNQKGKVYDVDYIESSNGETISTVTSLGYLFSIFCEAPLRLLDAYVTNYFSIIDVYSTTTDDGVGYRSNKTFDLKFSNEITTIGLKPFHYGDNNNFPLSEELYDNASSYIQKNCANALINTYMLESSKIVVLVFKCIFLLLPFTLLISFILRWLKSFKEYNKVLNLIIVLFGFSFLHILLHTVTGAIIDRYALPAFIATLLGIIFLGILLFKKLKK